VLRQACGQSSDPYSYDTPVGISHIELSYAYVRANASIDTALAITKSTSRLLLWA